MKIILDEKNLIEYNGYDVLINVQRKGGGENETDNGCYLQSKEKSQSKGSWFQSQNEHGSWKKSISCKKSKGKKAYFGVDEHRPQFCGLFFFFDKNRGGKYGRIL